MRPDNAKNQLIVQLPVTEGTDFDSLIHIEETLMQAFEQNRCAIVDSHDFGQGRFNIFISPKDSWAPVIEQAKASLKLRGVLDEAVIAKRPKSEDRFDVVWPEKYEGSFEI